MLAKRIIPCLDIKDGRTVKGINFLGLRDAGDPVELGAMYAEQGADELTFLDITATIEGRDTFAELVKKIALHLNIPFTVGGGIKSVHDVGVLLAAKAASAFPSINTSLKCSIVPAPPDAITGMSTISETCRVISQAKPPLVPSWFIDVRRISPAPRL